MQQYILLAIKNVARISNYVKYSFKWNKWKQNGINNIKEQAAWVFN